MEMPVTNPYQMIRRILWWSFIGSVILYLSVQSTMAAVPQPVYEWAKWVLDITFDENEIASDGIKARWIVLVGHDDSVTGGPIIDLVETEYLDCSLIASPAGSAEIVGDRAILNGGYGQCSMPNFRLKVLEMTIATGQPLDLGNPGQCVVDDTNVWARMTGQVDVATSTNNPVFYHPDLKFSVHQAINTVLNLVVKPGVSPAMSTNSTLFSLLPGDNTLGSRLFNCETNPCQGKHWANGVLLNTQLVTKQRWNMTTQATDVFLGHEPVNGHSFYGELVEMQIDPGCIIVSG